jgi:hypothetical protein
MKKIVPISQEINEACKALSKNTRHVASAKKIEVTSILEALYKAKKTHITFLIRVSISAEAACRKLNLIWNYGETASRGQVLCSISM